MGDSPPTESVEIPSRLTPVAVVLLLLTIWLFRRGAGKVFALAMLMYGKEPKWGEVIRWAREKS